MKKKIIISTGTWAWIPFILRPRHTFFLYIYFLNFAYNFIEIVTFSTMGNFLKRIFRVTHENLSVFLCYQSKNALKNQKLKKTIWLCLLLCRSHIFFLMVLKRGCSIFHVPLIISKCLFMIKRKFPKLIMMK